MKMVAVGVCWCWSGRVLKRRQRAWLWFTCAPPVAMVAPVSEEIKVFRSPWPHSHNLPNERTNNLSDSPKHREEGVPRLGVHGDENGGAWTQDRCAMCLCVPLCVCTQERAPLSLSDGSLGRVSWKSKCVCVNAKHKVPSCTILANMPCTPGFCGPHIRPQYSCYSCMHYLTFPCQQNQTFANKIRSRSVCEIKRQTERERQRDRATKKRDRQTENGGGG
mmetsp:Transcript_114875/g.199843  ORF Transcript_114875/g.199843 Transcript_114875/m.199843 type:complete len:220 (+) Transcript_114875:202-861(+)